ncbi:MAG: PEP-CTERM sorting domain-containing protein [Chthoniobacteraceae bacterium]
MIPGAQAQLFWAGSGGVVATAGGGTWDANTTVSWRDTSPVGTAVKWSNNGAAVFQGSAGGAVAMNGSLAIGALQFSSTAGPFNFTSTGGNLSFTGAGISSASTSDQNLNFGAVALSFASGSSAGAGAQGSHIHISISGNTNFIGTATAGSAVIANDGLMIFADQSSAGAATVTSTNQLSFRGNSTAGAAAITTSGILDFQGNAHDFSAASFINDTNGFIDVSGVTLGTDVSFGALTTGANSLLALGTTRLLVGSVNLTDGGKLDFDLGAGARGNIVVTTSLLGNTTAGGTQIDVHNVGGLVAGQKFTLIDWSSAPTVTGVESTDFSLQPLPAGFSGSLKIENNKLVLDVVPEPGTLSCMLIGAGCLGLRRHRR